ncbi:acyltransferase family protein [Microbacterium enclense]|uniref:acyltransferase family protein n=1 Tax=Microbacterium enclense TaxID=993073 RepID=UPI0036DF5A0B
MQRRSGWVRDDVGRREWVDLVKGVAIIMIVAYHSSLFLNSVGVDAAGIGRARIVLDLFPMPAFFLISGLFHTRVRDWSFADLWRRRLRQYLYLYVLWSVLRFLFYLVVPNVRADGAGQAADDPVALLLILVWPISSYWFIYALFVFTIVFWAFRRMPPWVLLALTAVASAVTSAGLLDTDNVGLNRMIEYLVFFVAGAYFHRRIYSAVERTGPLGTVVAVVGFAAFAAVATFVPRLGGIPGVALVGQVLVLTAGFTLATWLVRLRPLAWLTYVGVRSLNIYLVHIFVIALLALPLALVPEALDSLPGRGLLVIGAMTAVVTALSILLTRYLTRVSWLFVYPFRNGVRLRARRPAAERS